MRRTVIKIALLLSIAAFVLSIVLVVSPIIGISNSLFVTTMIVLFIGIFPLYLDAVGLLTHRTKGKMAWGRIPGLFTGLPKWFCTVFNVYFFGFH